MERVTADNVSRVECHIYIYILPMQLKRKGEELRTRTASDCDFALPSEPLRSFRTFSLSQAIFMCIDMQKSYLPSMSHGPSALEANVRMLRACRHLSIAIIVTEAAQDHPDSAVLGQRIATVWTPTPRFCAFFTQAIFFVRAESLTCTAPLTLHICILFGRERKVQTKYQRS